MVYSQNYGDKIVMKYGVHLEGWPLEKLANPSNISGLANLRTVSEALTNGQCFWKRLSPQEFDEYKLHLEKEVSDGLRKPLKHGGSIGEKRILQPTPSTQHTKRRRTGKGSAPHVEDGGIEGGQDEHRIEQGDVNGPLPAQQ